MAKLALTVLAARKTANGMYPIFVRIAAKKEKATFLLLQKPFPYIIALCRAFALLVKLIIDW